MEGGARRPGRRPGSVDNRAAVLTAARELFAEKGFAGTTIRAVASRADVDPALVMQFFTNKQRLFAASLDVPEGLGVALPDLLADPEGRAERLVAFLLDTLDSPEVRSRLTGLLRAAATEEAAAAMLRDSLRAAYTPVLAVLGPQAEVQLNLLGTVAVGLLMTRHVVRVEPLAGLERARLHALLVPVVDAVLQQLDG